MSSINQNRFDQLIRRLCDLQGPGSKVNDVLTELFPMIDVERVPGELLALGGTVLGMGASSIVGAAAQTGKVQLFNPADSGFLATITRVLISTGTTQIIRLAPTNIVLTTGVGTQLHRDLRRPITTRPTMGMFQESSAGLVGAGMQFRVTVSQTFDLNDENGVVVLAPGSGFSVGTSVVATDLQITFLWRERPAEASELNL